MSSIPKPLVTAVLVLVVLFLLFIGGREYIDHRKFKRQQAEEKEREND